MIIVLSLAMLMPGLSRAATLTEAVSGLASSAVSYVCQEANAPLFAGVTPVRFAMGVASIPVAEALGIKVRDYNYSSWISLSAWKNYATSFWSTAKVVAAEAGQDAKLAAAAAASAASAASDALTQPTPSDDTTVRSKLAKKA